MPLRYPVLPPYDNSRGTANIIDIMLRQGENEARAAEIRGGIWGDAVQGLAGVASDYFTQRGEQKAEQKFNAERDAVMTGLTKLRDQLPPDEWAAEAYRLLPTEVADKYVKGIQGATEAALSVQQLRQAVAQGDREAEEAARRRAAEGLKGTYNLVDAMGGPTNPTAAERLPAILPIASEVFGVDLTLEQIQQPEVWEAIGRGMNGAPETMTVGANQRVVERGPEGFREVVGVAEEPVDPLEVEEQTLKNQKLREEIRRLQADPGAPAPSLGDVRQLSKDWKTATQPVRDLNQQVDRMRSGMAAARRGDLGPASQAVLVTFQKVLDPPSVVRESEFERSGQALGIAQQFIGKWEKAIKGGAGVPLPELEKYAKLAEEIVQNQNSAYLDAERKRLETVASEFNIKPELIFEGVDYSAPDEGAGNPFRQGAGTQGAGANPFRNQ